MTSSVQLDVFARLLCGIADLVMYLFFLLPSFFVIKMNEFLLDSFVKYIGIKWEDYKKPNYTCDEVLNGL